MGNDMQISNIKHASKDEPSSPNEGDIATIKLCFAFLKRLIRLPNYPRLGAYYSLKYN